MDNGQIAEQIAMLYCIFLDKRINSFMLDHSKPPHHWLFLAYLVMI